MANKTYRLQYIGDKVKALLDKINNLSKSDIGLDQVNNTSDTDKPVSTLQRQALNEALEAAKTYTDNEIAEFDFIKIVSALPTTGLPNRIYLVPKTETDEQNLFDEYLWVNNSWEWIATKSVDVDLTDVYTKEEMAELLKLKVGVWNPNTQFNKDEVVIAKLYGYDDKKETIDVVLVCIQSHISENLDFPNDAEDFHDCWSVVCTVSNSSYDYTELKKEVTENRIRVERLKYYGDTNIVPYGYDEDEGYCGAMPYSITIFDEENKTVKIGVIAEEAQHTIDTEMTSFVVPYSIRYGDVDYLVTGIVDEGFYNSKYSSGTLWKLETLILPSSIETIGMNAFAGCPIANQIDLRNCTSIGDNAFITFTDMFAIKGYANSAAETYAKENGINFIYLETDVDKAYVDDKFAELTPFIINANISIDENGNGNVITETTYADVEREYNKGKEILLWATFEEARYIAPLICKSIYTFSFSLCSDGNNMIINCSDDGITSGWFLNITDVATQKELSNAVGEIETALDTIIEIQNELIGGDVV